MPLDCNSLAAAVALMFMLVDRLNLDGIILSLSKVGVSGLEGVVKALVTIFPAFSLKSLATARCFL